MIRRINKRPRYFLISSWVSFIAVNCWSVGWWNHVGCLSLILLLCCCCAAVLPRRFSSGMGENICLCHNPRRLDPICFLTQILWAERHILRGAMILNCFSTEIIQSNYTIDEMVNTKFRNKTRHSPIDNLYLNRCEREKGFWIIYDLHRCFFDLSFDRAAYFFVVVASKSILKR